MSETIAETDVCIAENEKSAENPNDSMEKLKFDDEDEKNVSVEDILGGKSLFLSDSEQEVSPVKKAITLEGAKEIENKETLALNEEAQVSDHDANPQDDDVDELDIQKLVTRKKICAFVDSDSETENSANTVEEQQQPNESNTKEVTKKKAFTLIDSESEEGETTNDIDGDEEVKTKKENRFTLIDSESEQEDISANKSKKNKKTKKYDEQSGNKSKKLKKKSKKKVKQITSGSEQDSNNDADDDDDENSTQTKKKHAGIVDSDSEQSNHSASDAENNHSQKEGEMEQETSKGKGKKDKPIRESAKKAMNDMQAIQSEQQRLHREMHISVPYHQPKRHTLQEFLNRRSISKPIENLSPSAVKHTPKNLKMSAEELETYAKLMEERAKEATEFFKSESEDDENEDQNDFETNPADPVDVGETSSIGNENTEFTINTAEEGFSDDDMELKDNLGVMDVEFPEASNTVTANNILTETSPNIETETSADFESETPLNNIETEEMISIPKETNDFNIPKRVDNNDFNMSIDYEELPSTSTAKCAIVTEVVELPRIDINTLNISPPKPLTTPKPSEQLKQLIMEKSSEVSPAIKGDANMMIDLETGDMYAKKPTGVDTWFQSLLKTLEPRKAKEKETVSILSTENGKLEISKVEIATNKETDPKKEPKPGAAYQQLKQSLKSIIYQKRLQKKKEEELEHNKCLNDDDEDDQDENMETGETEYDPENKPKIDLQSDDEENDICVNDEEEIVEYEDELDDDNEENDEVNEQNLELSQENSDHENESDEDEDEDEDIENEVEATQRKNRIIRAFDDDSSDDELDFLKTPKLCDPSPATATQLQLSGTKLFDAEEKRSASDEENELLNLCSGKFADTQMGYADEYNKPEAIISHMPMTQKSVGDIAEAVDELMELCSGAFETQKPNDKINDNFEPPHITKILSSSNDEVNDNKDCESPKGQRRTKKFTKKMKKKKFKLGFSDDENDTEEEVEQLKETEEDDDEVVAEKEDEEAEDIPQTFVEYDSEENEIVVELTKKDRVMRASNFVEKEAELSESEWGSADEDEKQMDNYDMELGDEDEFDQHQLRSELGQIHARKMLDQDIREVKKIQEMLFEDEELDGVGRQRQFKWKNAESGFTLDDNRNENGEGNGENSDDEDNEHMWRKKRFEREQLLLEKGLKEDPSSTGLIGNATLNIAGTPTTGGSTMRKLNIITTKKTTVVAKKNSPFLISKTITANAIKQQRNVRGSFLVRDKETLTKLAGLTKGPGGLNDGDDSMFTVSVKSAKAKNFVFATLTEEEHENQKRKADELLNSSSETGINYMKKRPRIEPKREKCLIDQLL